MSERISAASGGSTPQEVLADLKELCGTLRRGWRVTALCVLVCLSLAAIYLAGARRMYRATARLLVLQQGGRPLNMANNDPHHVMEGQIDYIPNHALIISSPVVIMQAIDQVGIENLPTLLEVKNKGKDPVEKAIALLTVSRPDRLAQVLRVDYHAGSRAEAIRTLEAITASYKNYLENTFQKSSNQVVALITKAKEDLSRELQKRDAEYLEFRRKTSVLASNEMGRTFIAQRLEQADRAQAAARERSLNLSMQLELGKKLAAQGTALWAIAHAVSQLGGDSNSLIANLSTSTTQFGATDYVRHLIEEQQQLTERYGVDNARAKELQAQISRIQERSRNSRNELEHVEVGDLLGSIEQSLKSVQALEVELGKRFEQAQVEARGVELDLIYEANLHAELERQRALFNTVVDQLKQARFASDYNNINSEILEPANSLRDPVSPRFALVLGLGLALGLLVGIGATLVLDWMDQRFRSLVELRQALDYSLLGQVFQLAEEEGVGVAEFGLISHELPRSAWAEAFRSIRTNIEFLRRHRNAQVLQLTSPHSGDGKSASASNLAISLAKAGRRVVLIDADLRKPSLHKVFGASRERGLTLALNDVLAVSQVIQPTAVEQLDLIAAGPVSAHPAELLASPQLGRILGELKQTYDLVIIDSSPILAVTDPAIIGALVDGLVLVVQPSALKRRDAELTREVLASLGTPVLGTVINRINRQEVKAGFGYGYGYGYGSTAEAAHGDRELRPAPSANGHAPAASSESPA
jgi:capsular exopolysaccharide synthesis family protein